MMDWIPRDGPQNVDLFTIQPLNLADNLKELQCYKIVLCRTLDVGGFFEIT
jgi:hypothetical protein